MFHAILFLLVFIPFTVIAQERDKDKGNNKKPDRIQQDLDSVDQRLSEKQKGIAAATDRVKEMIQKYGKNKGRMVAAGRVWTGISPEMALDSWGEPVKKESTVLNEIVTDRWFYEGNKFLYFENGRLASWRE